MSKSAEARVVDVLLASGISLSVWHMPAELDEVRSGPPITYDDLLEFHFELGTGASVDSLLSAVSAGWLENARPQDVA